MRKQCNTKWFSVDLEIIFKTFILSGVREHSNKLAIINQHGFPLCLQYLSRYFPMTVASLIGTCFMVHVIYCARTLLHRATVTGSDHPLLQKILRDASEKEEIYMRIPPTWSHQGAEFVLTWNKASPPNLAVAQITTGARRQNTQALCLCNTSGPLPSSSTHTYTHPYSSASAFKPYYPGLPPGQACPQVLEGERSNYWKNDTDPAFIYPLFVCLNNRPRK